MADFIIAIIFGVAQTFLSAYLVLLLKEKETRRVAFFVVLKILSYILCAYLLAFKFTNSVFDCLFGYIAGVPLGVIGLLIYLVFWKREDYEK